MKRLISVLLALALLAALSVPVFATEDKPLEGRIAVLCTGNMDGQIDLYPRVKAARDYYKSLGAEVILVDAGNFMRGSSWVNADRGATAYTLMNAVGYDVARLGPMDFSYTDATTGYPYHGNFTRYYTQAMLQDGTEEITYYKDKNQTQHAVLPAREASGFAAVSSEYVPLKEGIYSFEPWHDVVTESGRRVRFQTFNINWIAPEAEQTDSAVSRATADPVPVDFLQDGFLGTGTMDAPAPTEQAEYTFSILNDSPVEAGNYGGVVLFPGMWEGCCGVRIEDGDQWFDMENVDLYSFEPDPEVAALVEQIKAQADADPNAQVRFQNSVLLEGRDSVSRRGETNMGDLVTDALSWYAENYIDGWNKDLPLVAIQNGGNLDDFLYPGPVTEVDLLRALPFSPMGVGVIELTGAQLLETLEAAGQNLPCPGFAQVSGMKYTVKDYETFDAGEAYGSFFRADSIVRTEITEIGGQAFDPEATYAVVADNFLINGNDTYYTMKEAKAAGAAYVNNGGGVKTRDVVALYVNQALGGAVDYGYYNAQDRITVKELPFDDVSRWDYFYEPVRWALENEITDGTSDTTFSPDDTCTRSQVVTFLWRSESCPTPAVQTNPFGDVDPEAWYFRPVLWALGKEITDGTSDTTFSPDGGCTRAQVVTFLWRSRGCPSVEGASCPFSDVGPDAWYREAVLWAVQAGITDGTSDTTFSPDQTCTRGQIVTFLYRANPPEPTK